MLKTFLQPRRTLALGLVMAMILTLFSLPSFAAGLNGSGTADSPYLIGTEAELIAFRDKVNGGESGAYAKLTANISLTGYWSAIGVQDTPYTGTFDGDGHSITNFMTSYYDPHSALFGYSSGTIQNLTVDTGNNYLFGGDFAAAICVVNRGTIQNCNSKGYIYGYTDKAFVGGIAAVNFGTISHCTNTALVGGVGADACGGGIVGVSASGSVTNCTNTGSVTVWDGGKQPTELCTGGIVGLNYQSTIDQCTNQGIINSDSTQGYTGGVAGLNNGVVRNSLNTAGVTGSGLHGGVVGYVFTNADTGMTAQVRGTLDTSGHVVYGKNEGGSVTNNFYKAASGSTGTDQSAVTDAQLKSGEVAYRLNGNNTANPIWGQKLDTDAAPSLGAADVVYAQYQNGAIVGYTNNPDQVHDHQFDESGHCTVEGCGYESVRLDGWTLTLDGALGVTFYYEIDPLYLADDSEVSVTFTMDGKQTKVSLNENYSYRTDNKTVYGFRFYVDSDKATHEIAPVLTIRKGDVATVTLSQEHTYRIYDYLQTVIENESGSYSAELVQLAKTLATYDYYANEYFKYSASYTPEINLLSLSDVTSDVLAPYKQVSDTADDTEYPVSYYGANLYLQTAVFPRYYATLADPAANPVDTDNLYMGYRVSGSGELYTYVKVTKSGNLYAGSAAKRPASDLNATYEMAFFVKEGDSYRQVSQINKLSVYSYIYTAVTNTAAKPTLQDAMKALYLYGEAAKAYFASVN